MYGGVYDMDGHIHDTGGESKTQVKFSMTQMEGSVTWVLSMTQVVGYMTRVEGPYIGGWVHE